MSRSGQAKVSISYNGGVVLKIQLNPSVYAYYTKTQNQSSKNAYQNDLPSQQSSHFSVVNDLQNFPAIFENDSAFIEKIRQAWGFTNRDQVRIFVVPKGQSRVRVGSFLNDNRNSRRTNELHINMRSTRHRLNELELGLSDPILTDDERRGLIASMQSRLTEYERALKAEMARLAAMPRSGVIVVEREE